MKLLIFGPPGSGKGTQSLRLSRMLGVRHVSTGDLLRNAIRDETPLGFDVSECVAEGRLVPDVLISELVHARLGQLAARDSGFLLDGFPRTLDQLDALLGWLAPDGIDAGLNLVVPTDVLVQRLAARARSDDITAAIETRLNDFEDQTGPVLSRLDAEGLLLSVDADRSIADVTNTLVDALRVLSRRANGTSLSLASSSAVARPHAEVHEAALASSPSPLS